MTDEELYELVRNCYVNANSDYMQDQLAYCEQRIKELSENAAVAIKMDGE